MQLFKLFKKTNKMKILKSNYKNLNIIKGITHHDNRGNFREIFKEKYSKKKFIFWCTSKSKKKVIRGLHLQMKFKQEIIVSVLKGKIFDVAVDLRKGSKTFGKSHKIILSEKNTTGLLIPAGFAHGFCGLEDENIVLYGCTNYRSKNNEVGILWNDNTLKIKWPFNNPITSKKDKKNISFLEFKKLYF